jgi:hypothetical protein
MLKRVDRPPSPLRASSGTGFQPVRDKLYRILPSQTLLATARMTVPHSELADVLAIIRGEEFLQRCGIDVLRNEPH